MICKKCYTNNEDGAKFCVGCGERMEEEKNETTTSNVNTQVNNTQSTSNNEAINNTQGFSNSQNNNINGQNVQNYNNAQYNSNTQNSNNDGTIPVYSSVSAIISIVVSFLCCGGMIGAIFGILSLVEGSKVKEFVQQGNIEMAREKLKQAKKWNMIAWIIAGIGAALCILYIIFMFGAMILSEM